MKNAKAAKKRQERQGGQGRSCFGGNRSNLINASGKEIEAIIACSSWRFLAALAFPSLRSTNVHRKEVKNAKTAKKRQERQGWIGDDRLDFFKLKRRSGLIWCRENSFSLALPGGPEAFSLVDQRRPIIKPDFPARDVHE